MRKFTAALAAATTTTLHGGRDASAELVCMALALALVCLLCRIAAVW